MDLRFRIIKGTEEVRKSAQAAPGERN